MKRLIAWGAVVMGVIALLPAMPAVASDITYTEVSFQGSSSVTLHGVIVSRASPIGERENPGMVLVHGSGIGKRDRYMQEAEAFARGGIVTLVYDKRAVGYSITQRDYSVLADDALAGVHLLQEQADVNPDMVGLWGLSEGGYVAPLAATKSKEIAFLVLVGAPGMPPAQQTAWSATNELIHAGASGSVVDKFVPNVYRLLVDAGQFPQPYYDPVPPLEQLRQPVLALWGTYDQTVPPQESSQILQRALAQGGNKHYTIKFFAGDHKLHRTPDEGFTRLDELTPGYTDFVVSWINDLVWGKLPTATAEEPPQQALLSAPLARLAWYESSWVQLGSIAFLLVTFLGYQLPAWMRQLRGRYQRTPVSRPMSWLAAMGFIATFGLLLYITLSIVTGSAVIGVIVLGRPLPWLLLQLFAWGVIVAAIIIVRAWWNNRQQLGKNEQLWLGLLLFAVILFAPLALHWGLLFP